MPITISFNSQSNTLEIHVVPTLGNDPWDHKFYLISELTDKLDQFSEEEENKKNGIYSKLGILGRYRAIYGINRIKLIFDLEAPFKNNQYLDNTFELHQRIKKNHLDQVTNEWRSFAEQLSLRVPDAPIDITCLSYDIPVCPRNFEFITQKKISIDPVRIDLFVWRESTASYLFRYIHSNKTTTSLTLNFDNSELDDKLCAEMIKNIEKTNVENLILEKIEFSKETVKAINQLLCTSQLKCFKIIDVKIKNNQSVNVPSFLQALKNNTSIKEFGCYSVDFASHKNEFYSSIINNKRICTLTLDDNGIDTLSSLPKSIPSLINNTNLQKINFSFQFRDMNDITNFNAIKKIYKAIERNQIYGNLHEIYIQYLDDIYSNYGLNPEYKLYGREYKYCEKIQTICHTNKTHWRKALNKQNISSLHNISFFFANPDINLQKLQAIKVKYNLVDCSQASLEKALRNAAYKNHPGDVEYLITQVKNINATDGKYEKKSVLHWAVIKEHKNIILLLLNAGADPELADGNKMTAKNYAERCQSKEILYYFKDLPRACKIFSHK